MAAQTGDVIFRERGVFLAYKDDVTQIHGSISNTRPQELEEGKVAYLHDAMGQKMFTFRQNLVGSTMALGGLYSKKLLVVTNLDSGTTTSATKASAFGTSPLYVGGLVVVHDDAGAAGAAPEGEWTVVKSHTANTLTFESSLPLTAALVVNDDITVLSPKLIASADGDYNYVIAGVAMAAIPALDWGWFQFSGMHPKVVHKSTDAVVAGAPVVADAAAVGAFGTDAQNLWVGYGYGTYAADVAGNAGPVVMALAPVYAV